MEVEAREKLGEGEGEALRNTPGQEGIKALVAKHALLSEIKIHQEGDNCAESVRFAPSEEQVEVETNNRKRPLSAVMPIG